MKCTQHAEEPLSLNNHVSISAVVLIVLYFTAENGSVFALLEIAHV